MKFVAPLALAILAFTTQALAASKAPAPPALPEPPAADWRTPDPENVLIIDTSKGRVIVELSPQVAPRHVERVRLLTRRGFYDGLEFFRVIDGFMDQTGDPQNDGMGASELPDLADEFFFPRGPSTPFALFDRVGPDREATGATEAGFIGVLPVRTPPGMQMMMTATGTVNGWGQFCGGVLGMAKSGAPDSANSQFFLMRDTVASLNRNYTALGRVLSGMEAVRAIKVGEPVAPPRDVMTRVRLLADLPERERPKIQVLNTASPSFKAIVERARAQAPVTICDIAIPVRVQ